MIIDTNDNDTNENDNNTNDNNTNDNDNKMILLSNDNDT